MILDCEYNYNRHRRNHHNSRPKKYCSLVSSRQREGGSLPSNVNVSNCNLSICEPSFLNEVLHKRRTIASGGGIVNKTERTCSGTSCTSGTSVTSSSSTGHDSLTSTTGGAGAVKDIDLSGFNNSNDTIINIGDNYIDDNSLLTNDSTKKVIIYILRF